MPKEAFLRESTEFRNANTKASPFSPRQRRAIDGIQAGFVLPQGSKSSEQAAVRWRVELVGGIPSLRGCAEAAADLAKSHPSHVLLASGRLFSHR